MTEFTHKYAALNAATREVIFQLDSIEEMRDRIANTHLVILYSPEALLEFAAQCIDMQEDF